MDDTDLISRARNGESTAFEALVDRYQSSLLSVTWSVLGNREDARDATQEAFLSAFHRLESFDSGRSFKTWLTTIAWRRCLDMKRREKTRRTFLQKLRTNVLSETAPATADARIEDSETFSPILARLGPKERLALSLRVNEGYTAAEIAEVLGCAESSARVYVFNALQKIRKLWNGRKPDV